MNKKLLGDRIKEARTARDCTLDELASAVGLNKSTISRYERGEIENPKIPVIQAIATALHTNPAWLVGKSEDRSFSPSPEPTVPVPTLRLSDSAALSLSPEEKDLIAKFRALDDRGQAAVLNVLNHEYDSLPGEKANSPAKEA